MPEFTYYDDIPPIFQSLEKGGPFEKCMHCERSLLDEAADAPAIYMVERVFRRREPILEYAVCWECRRGFSTCISPKSLARMTAFLEEHVDMEARSERLLQVYQETNDLQGWLDHCAITKAPVAEDDNFQLVGVCSGPGLILSAFPLVISESATEQFQRLLSTETKGWMDDFVSDNFGMPPEFCDSPSPIWI